MNIPTKSNLQACKITACIGFGFGFSLGSLFLISCGHIPAGIMSALVAISFLYSASLVGRKDGEE